MRTTIYVFFWLTVATFAWMSLGLMAKPELAHSHNFWIGIGVLCIPSTGMVLSAVYLLPRKA